MFLAMVKKKVYSSSLISYPSLGCRKEAKQVNGLRERGTLEMAPLGLSFGSAFFCVPLVIVSNSVKCHYHHPFQPTKKAPGKPEFH